MKKRTAVKGHTRRSTVKWPEVLRLLAKGWTGKYSTSMTGTGAWVTSPNGDEHEHFPSGTLYALTSREFVTLRHSFPSGDIILTAEGREYAREQT